MSIPNDMGWTARHGRLERWALARVEPASRRRLLILGIAAATALASLAFCVVFYVLFGMFPKTPIDYLIEFGLPVAAPMLIAPPMLSIMLRMLQRLHDRSTLLEEEVRRRQQAESRLAILVTTDELTQLANRRAFFARATEIAEGTGQDASVAVVDLDEFKRLNDTKGHAAGDAELRRYGSILRELVDANGLAARLGGEEFGLILPHRTAEEALPFLAELRERFAADGEVTASIGVADWPAGQPIDRALASADAALYRAKQRGRNRVEVATADDAQFGTDLAPVARR
jgi:diguanylate cyclase (GGDEF)-like protein